MSGKEIGTAEAGLAILLAFGICALVGFGIVAAVVLMERVQVTRQAKIGRVERKAVKPKVGGIGK